MGFSVNKFRMSNGQVTKSYTNSAISISGLIKLDPSEPQLYLAVDGIYYNYLFYLFFYFVVHVKLKF